MSGYKSSRSVFAGGLTPISRQAGRASGTYKHKKHSKNTKFRTKPLFDCSGNRVDDPTIASKVAIERAMNAMSMRTRAAISPRQKWAAVDLHEQGKIEAALALLRRSV